MSAVEQNPVEKQTSPAADMQPKTRLTKPRQVDSGPQTLPTMEHFVQLVRKAQCTELIRSLLESASGNPAPITAALINGEPGTLTDSMTGVNLPNHHQGRELDALLTDVTNVVTLKGDVLDRMLRGVCTR